MVQLLVQNKWRMWMGIGLVARLGHFPEPYWQQVWPLYIIYIYVIMLVPTQHQQSICCSILNMHPVGPQMLILGCFNGIKATSVPVTRRRGILFLFIYFFRRSPSLLNSMIPSHLTIHLSNYTKTQFADLHRCRDRESRLAILLDLHWNEMILSYTIANYRNLFWNVLVNLNN